MPTHVGDTNDQFDGFGIGSTGVRFGQFFWLIGGVTACNGRVFMNGQFDLANKNSYIWSIQKKKWFLGPKYPNLTLAFDYACPIVLDSTIILFIGLVEKPYFHDDPLGAPKHTITYDFETKLWKQQESLDFPTDKVVFTACVMEKSENSSRLVRSSFEIHCLPQFEFVNFFSICRILVISSIEVGDYDDSISSIDYVAWLSNTNEIKWYGLEIVNQVPGARGTLLIEILTCKP